MNYCLCCSEVLLQQVRGSEITWFCRHCWQDMPVLSCHLAGLLNRGIKEELPSTSQLRENVQATTYTSSQNKITGWIGVKDALV
ncbi:hypothetical protein [Nostoc sp. FACHB-110]|uniref:hypothetical protein n=1 Tax=Nostoc sp. FACHB-110 TaxID=2692834 RepID=UPI001683607A|nr:hypothetical protein [Nostoc sp. FACHB-110]MBD2440879.1 hypothetical protein [Nostoc sp. FACHB-110]